MIAYIIIGVLGLALLTVTLLVDDVLGSLLDFDSGLISGTSIGGFAAALGFGGALTLNAGGGSIASLVAGVVAGVVVGGVAALVQRSLVKAPVPVTRNMTNVVGVTAAVTAAVRPGSLGQVAVRVGDHVSRISAQSDEELPVGTEVQVVSSVSPTLVVVRAL